MVPLLALSLLPILGAATDTTIVVGRLERDLTGDGKPEVLQLVGKGKSIDSLDVTFSIESGGVIIYRFPIGPLTRHVGKHPSDGMRTRAEQRQWLAEYPSWFFHKDKFLQPSEFLAAWRDQGPEHVNEVAAVIARDGGFAADTVRAKALWAQIQQSGVTIFEFSPGGDAVVAIAWSAKDARFYRVIECC